MSLVNLMVSTKKSKKPFKNTKIRPAENVTRVEDGSPNPRWSTRAGSSWVVRAGRPTCAGSSWVICAGHSTCAGLPASASVVQPSSPARVREPAVFYPGSTRVDMPLSVMANSGPCSCFSDGGECIFKCSHCSGYIPVSLPPLSSCCYLMETITSLMSSSAASYSGSGMGSPASEATR
ncbi:hypothetical protein YC2023_076015 [Brassica napus]